MGGGVRVSSAVGVGTAFTVELPVAAAATSLVAREAGTVEGAGLPDGTATTVAPESVRAEPPGVAAASVTVEPAASAAPEPVEPDPAGDAQ